jgi:hypothetical protein
MGEEMALHSRRSSVSVRVLLAAGVMALAAAGCASQGVTPGSLGSPTAVNTQPVPGTQTVLPTSETSSLASASDSTATSPSDEGTSTSTSTAPTGQVYKPTDVVTEGGFKLKINSITMPYNPPADSMFTPAPSREWLLLDFTVTNVGTEQLMFSTLGAFDIRDSANASYLSSVAAGDQLKAKAFQDHEMNPGDTSSGELIFDLSQKASGYRLIFKGNMWHASQTPPSILIGH